MTGQDQWAFGINANVSNDNNNVRLKLDHLERAGLKRRAGSGDHMDEPRVKRKMEQVSARFGRIDLDRHSPLEGAYGSDGDDEDIMEDPDPIAFVEEPADDFDPTTYKEVHLDGVLKLFLNNARHHGQNGDLRFLMNKNVRPDALVPYHTVNGHPATYPHIQELPRDEEWIHLPQTSPPLVTFPFEEDQHSDDQNREDTDTISSGTPSPLQIVELYDHVEEPMDYEAMEME